MRCGLLFHGCSPLQFIAGFLFLQICSAQAATHQNPSLTKQPRIVSLKGWCPLSCDPGESKLGLLTDMTIRAYEAVGLRPEYETMSFPNAVAGLKRGTVDGFIGAFAEEVPFAILSNTIVGATDFCFYSAKGDNWKYTGIPSLKDRFITYSAGFKYFPELDKYLSDNPESAIGKSGDSLIRRRLQMLASKRIDSILEDRTIAHLHKFSESNYVNSGCLNLVNKGYLAFSPVNKKRTNRLKEAFDRGVQIIYQNGTLEKIADSYGISLDFWFFGLSPVSKETSLPASNKKLGH